MIVLESNAKVIITDSGGVQKEAYFFQTPAVIPRKETEWVEIVETGWNILTGANKQKIINSVKKFWGSHEFDVQPNFYGDGNAVKQIRKIIEEYMISK